MKSLSVLLVGSGRMGAEHAQRYAALPSVFVTAAVDIDEERLRAFCSTHSIANSYTSVEAALANHDFDAASIVTPDAWHAQGSIACLNAGIPVLCEKPLSESLESSRNMVVAAEQSGLLNTVNLSYRVSGSLHQARQWVDEGRLGDIRHVEASYRQSWLCSPYWGDWKTEDAWLWRLSSSHGSTGVLGDIGIHILDFVTAGVGMEIAGLQCRLKTFNKAPGNKIGEYKLDANDSCALTVEFANGALGSVHMSRYHTGYMNDLFLTIHGTEGAVKISTGNEGDKLSVCLDESIHTQTWRDVPCVEQADTFERFVIAIRNGNTQCDPDFAHAAQLQQVIQSCVDSHEKESWIACKPG